MVKRARGTILFTGASAGLRGSANFAAFAGANDTAFIRTSFAERYAPKDQDGILNPKHIAENYGYLHTQPRDTWTFELDLRLYMERW